MPMVISLLTSKLRLLTDTPFYSLDSRHLKEISEFQNYLMLRISRCLMVEMWEIRNPGLKHIAAVLDSWHMQSAQRGRSDGAARVVLPAFDLEASFPSFGDSASSFWPARLPACSRRKVQPLLDCPTHRLREHWSVPTRVPARRCKGPNRKRSRERQEGTAFHRRICRAAPPGIPGQLLRKSPGQLFGY